MRTCDRCGEDLPPTYLDDPDTCEACWDYEMDRLEESFIK